METRINQVNEGYVPLIIHEEISDTTKKFYLDTKEALKEFDKWKDHTIKFYPGDEPESDDDLDKLPVGDGQSDEDPDPMETDEPYQECENPFR